MILRLLQYNFTTVIVTLFHQSMSRRTVMRLKICIAQALNWNMERVSMGGRHLRMPFPELILML